MQKSRVYICEGNVTRYKKRAEAKLLPVHISYGAEEGS